MFKILFTLISLVSASCRIVLTFFSTVLKTFYLLINKSFNWMSVFRYKRKITKNARSYNRTNENHTINLSQTNNLSLKNTYKEIDGDVLLSLTKLDHRSYKVIKSSELKNNKINFQFLVISEFGIFVIKTVDLKGRIFGNKDSYNWSFYNNISKSSKQINNYYQENKINIELLANSLNCKSSKFKSIVVFSDSTDLFITGTINVINEVALLEKIYSYKSVIINKKCICEIAKNFYYDF